MSKTNSTDPLQSLFSETPSIDEEVEFKKLMIVEDILKLMKEQNMSKKAFAQKMGVVPSRVTSMLNGTNNMTIETLVKAAEAVGARLEQAIIPKSKKAKWIQYSEEEIHHSFKAINTQTRKNTFAKIPGELTENAFIYEQSA